MNVHPVKNFKSEKTGIPILIKNKLKENIELKNLTSFKIGGAARFFVSAEAVEDVIEAVSFAEEHSLDLFILGGGSNVLISDKGFDGLVLQVNLKGIEIENETDENVSVIAACGRRLGRIYGLLR